MRIGAKTVSRMQDVASRMQDVARPKRVYVSNESIDQLTFPRFPSVYAARLFLYLVYRDSKELIVRESELRACLNVPRRGTRESFEHLIATAGHADLVTLRGDGLRGHANTHMVTDIYTTCGEVRIKVNPEFLRKVRHEKQNFTVIRFEDWLRLRSARTIVLHMLACRFEHLHSGAHRQMPLWWFRYALDYPSTMDNRTMMADIARVRHEVVRVTHLSFSLERIKEWREVKALRFDNFKRVYVRLPRV